MICNEYRVHLFYFHTQKYTWPNVSYSAEKSVFSVYYFLNLWQQQFQHRQYEYDKRFMRWLLEQIIQNLTQRCCTISLLHIHTPDKKATSSKSGSVISIRSRRQIFDPPWPPPTTDTLTGPLRWLPANIWAFCWEDVFSSLQVQITQYRLLINDKKITRMKQFSPPFKWFSFFVSIQKLYHKFSVRQLGSFLLSLFGWFFLFFSTKLYFEVKFTNNAQLIVE